MTAVLAIGAFALAGCSSSPGPVASSATAAVSASTTPSPAPAAPALVPDGTAAENLPYFTEIMNAVWASDQSVQGRAFIDALVAAGFPRADMEVTNDRTTVDNPADSIQFSVRWDGECLVGQVGPSTPEPTAVVLPEVPGGTCLIGQTRPIDW